MKLPQRLYINVPDKIHNTYGISIETENTELLEKFRKIVVSRYFSGSMSEPLRLRLKPFLQGESKEWLYIEFLNSREQNLILKEALIISKLLEMDLYLGYEPAVLISDAVVKELKDLDIEGTLYLLYVTETGKEIPQI